MDTNPKSWVNQLLGLAIALAVSALLLHWVWSLIHPLLLGLVGVLIVAAGFVMLLRRR
jgi:membrane protein required for beta-lactamase induction